MDVINTFIEDLLSAGASPNDCMELLAKKLKVQKPRSRHLFFQSDAWARRSVNNPFTQEFLDIMAEDATEVTRENGKVVSVKIDLNKNKSGTS